MILQVFGEIVKRLAHPRDFPSRIMTAQRVAIPDCLQPGVVSMEEPTLPFPRSGYYKAGIYYAVKNCTGNLVNVCQPPCCLLH
jgi:hypothetical protein